MKNGRSCNESSWPCSGSSPGLYSVFLKQNVQLLCTASLEDMFNLQVSVWKLWPAQAHLCHKNNCMNPLKRQKPSWSPYYTWLMLKKELTNVCKKKMYLLMNIAIISNTMDLSKTYLPSVSTWIHFTINFNLTISVKMNVEPNGQPYSYLSAVYLWPGCNQLGHHCNNHLSDNVIIESMNKNYITWLWISLI